MQSPRPYGGRGGSLARRPLLKTGPHHVYCLIGVFLGAMDETIIATLAGPIASEFKSLYLLSWLATAYLLSSAACLPIMGRLTDIFGRGPGLVLCNILFAAGNLICGLARDPYVFLSAALQQAWAVPARGASPTSWALT